jgi:Ca2+/Na+ antiporter
MEWIYYIKYIKKDMAIVLVYLHIAMFFLVSKNVRLNNIIISITLLNIYLLWLILKNKNPFQIYFENLVTYFNNNDITFLQIIYETFDGFLYL